MDEPAKSIAPGARINSLVYHSFNFKREAMSIVIQFENIISCDFICRGIFN